MSKSFIYINKSLHLNYTKYYLEYTTNFLIVVFKTYMCNIIYGSFWLTSICSYRCLSVTFLILKHIKYYFLYICKLNTNELFWNIYPNKHENCKEKMKVWNLKHILIFFRCRSHFRCHVLLFVYCIRLKPIRRLCCKVPWHWIICTHIYIVPRYSTYVKITIIIKNIVGTFRHISDHS